MTIQANQNLYGVGIGTSNGSGAAHIEHRPPTASDINYPIAQRWIDTSGNAEYVLTSISTFGGVVSANWQVTASATGAVSTINNLSPTGGNITIAGTANQIAISNAGSTVTLSTPATFIAPGSIASTTTLTGGTGITATTGNIVASTGNITATTGNIAASAGTITGGAGGTFGGNVAVTNGNVSMQTAGNKLNIATGANASIGTSAAMIGGTTTVNTTAVTASSLIFLTVNTPGGTQGALSAPSASIVAGTSFVINSSSNLDTSTVNWWIIN